MRLDHFQGALLGLALGDALGAAFEGGPMERLTWRLIGRTREGFTRWTDDTRMSLDIAESILACPNLDTVDLARRFAAGYHWSRGYGPGAARVLKQIARGTPWQEANRHYYKDGSFGNGAAMRAPVIGLYFANRPSDLVNATKASAEITHAHQLGMEGAVVIAKATAAAVQGAGPDEILSVAADAGRMPLFRSRFEIATEWHSSSKMPSAKEVARQLGNGIAATESCVTAVYVATRFQHSPFLQMLDFIKAIKGDVDTIGAMAGALWGASRGAGDLPQEKLDRLEKMEMIKSVAAQLHQVVISQNEKSR